MGRLKYSGDILDVSHFIDWRLDTLAPDDLNFTNGPAKSPDSGMVWAVMSSGRGYGQYWSPTEQHPFRHIEFRLMFAMWGIQTLGTNPLTIWEEISDDSIRLICIDSVMTYSGISEIRKVSRFPDSSVVLYGGLSEWGEMDPSGSDIFFRSASYRDFRTLYEAHWSTASRVKTYVLANRFLENKFRISEITEFFTILDPRTNRHLQFGEGAFSDIIDGRLIDSAHIKVIDLWDLAKEKFGIDTTKLRK